MNRRLISVLVALTAVVILGGARVASVNTVIGEQPACEQMMLAADTKQAMSCVADGTCPACKSGEVAVRCTYAGNIKICTCLPNPSGTAK